ncbi:MAG: TonB-dependent receptor [Saprospiraceae bacterium]
MKNILITILLLLPYLLIAQNKATISGHLIDTQKENIAYATISLFDEEQKLILGAISDEEGKFNLSEIPYGNVLLEIQFLGYKTVQQNLSLERKNKKVNIGTITMELDQEQLEEVTVVAEKSDYNLRLDKKVFNVGKDVLSQGGSAIDILNQVPLVTVNVNGGVELRGSGNVQILVNGKRSGLTLNNALDQIPGENIASIEVITNPSASFDAAGSAGIINIILKKDRGMGWNGQLRLQAGYPADHGIIPGLNYKSKKLNLFSNFRWRYSDYNGFYTTEQRTTENGTDSFLSREEDEDRHDDGRSGYFGADYYINDNNTITLAYFRAETKDTDETILDYKLRTDGQDETSIRTNGNSVENRNYNQFEFNYTSKLAKKGQKFTVDFQYDFWNSTKDWSLINSGDIAQTAIGNRLRTNNIAGSRDFVLRSDYKHPLKNNASIETGFKLENRIVANEYLAENFVNDEWTVYNGIDNDVDYGERIGAAYVQYQGAFKKIEYMLGLRSEYTFLDVKDQENEFTNETDYLNFFPSMHLSYSIAEGNTLQWSYSRRINRPSLWNLYPFFEITDFNLQQTGNPNLQPSFSHALELAYLGRLGLFTVNPSVYFRQTSDPFSNFIFQNEQGTFIYKPINIEERTSTGFELSLRYIPAEWVSLGGEFNIFHFSETGEFEGVNLDAKNSSWFARANVIFNLPKGYQLQTRFDYFGAERRALIEELDMYQLTIGLSKSFFNDQLAVDVRARNILDSQVRRSLVETADYRIEDNGKRIGERFSIGIVYKFNQDKRQRMRQARRGNR